MLCQRERKADDGLCEKDREDVVILFTNSYKIRYLNFCFHSHFISISFKELKKSLEKKFLRTL